MRGIGVAVITSVSGAAPLAESARRWCTPKRCCSSMTARPRRWNSTPDWKSACVPTAICRSAARDPLERLAPLGRAHAAGEQHGLDARRLGERRDGRKMLARQKLGRRHQRRLAAGLDDVGHGEQRDDGLARADVALQQPQHARLAGEVALDLGERLALRVGQAEGQGGFDLRRGAFRPIAMPCRGRASGCRGRSQARAGSQPARRRRAAARRRSSVRSPRRSPGDGRTEAHRRRTASRALRRGRAKAIPAGPAAGRARCRSPRQSTFGESPAVSR